MEVARVSDIDSIRAEVGSPLERSSHLRRYAGNQVEEMADVVCFRELDLVADQERLKILLGGDDLAKTFCVLEQSFRSAIVKIRLLDPVPHQVAQNLLRRPHR